MYISDVDDDTNACDFLWNDMFYDAVFEHLNWYDYIRSLSLRVFEKIIL